jgi:copper(I)-binding protein
VTSRRRCLLVVGPLALVLALATGCGSGFDATARQSYAPGDGVQAGSGDLRVVSALVVAPEGSSDGVLMMAVVNNSDTDEEITSIDSAGATADYTGSHVIPANQTVVFGAGSDSSVTLHKLGAKPGEAVTVRIGFADAEPITLHTVVVPATGDYASITPAPAASPTPSDSGGTPSGSVSPSPSSS